MKPGAGKTCTLSKKKNIILPTLLQITIKQAPQTCVIDSKRNYRRLRAIPL